MSSIDGVPTQVGPLEPPEGRDGADAAAAAGHMPSPEAVEAAALARARETHANVFARFWAKLSAEVLEGEQKVLNAEEPRNTSGFTPNAPPSIGVAALNIAETAAARLGLMHPFRTYAAWVAPGVLMRGSEQGEKGWAALKEQGVRTVVNLRYEDNSEAREQAALGLENVWLPSYDQSLPTEAEVARFLAVVNDPAKQPVYVHCEQGVGRTGVMCAAFRMQHDGWTAEQAIAEARRMGMNSADQENYIRKLEGEIRAGKL
jgi:protein tyrosine phosphatase (PTP) superfamily phosphohydrolase (DUF442 family)